MVNKKIRLLRDYQLDAVHALQSAAAAGKDRFLFEMATGTGKTLLSAAIAKLYLRTENATPHPVSRRSTGVGNSGLEEFSTLTSRTTASRRSSTNRSGRNGSRRKWS